MTPGSSQPPTPPYLFKLVVLEVVAALYYNNRDGAIMRVPFTIITYICWSFIKLIGLAPSSVCFSTTATIYLHLLSRICVFLLTVMYAFKSTALRVGVQTLHNTISL